MICIFIFLCVRVSAVPVWGYPVIHDGDHAMSETMAIESDGMHVLAMAIWISQDRSLYAVDRSLGIVDEDVLTCIDSYLPIVDDQLDHDHIFMSRILLLNSMLPDIGDWTMYIDIEQFDTIDDPRCIWRSIQELSQQIISQSEGECLSVIMPLDREMVLLCLRISHVDDDKWQQYARSCSRIQNQQPLAKALSDVTYKCVTLLDQHHCYSGLNSPGLAIDRSFVHLRDTTRLNHILHAISSDDWSMNAVYDDDYTDERQERTDQSRVDISEDRPISFVGFVSDVEGCLQQKHSHRIATIVRSQHRIAISDQHIDTSLKGHHTSSRSSCDLSIHHRVTALCYIGAQLMSTQYYDRSLVQVQIDAYERCRDDDSLLLYDIWRHIFLTTIKSQLNQNLLYRFSGYHDREHAPLQESFYLADIRYLEGSYATVWSVSLLLLLLIVGHGQLQHTRTKLRQIRSQKEDIQSRCDEIDLLNNILLHDLNAPLLSLQHLLLTHKSDDDTLAHTSSLMLAIVDDMLGLTQSVYDMKFADELNEQGLVSDLLGHMIQGQVAIVDSYGVQLSYHIESQSQMGFDRSFYILVIVRNLLDNIIRHDDTRRIHITALDSDGLYIRLAYEGVPMSEDLIALYTPGYQSVAQSRRRGFRIIRKLMELLGASIALGYDDRTNHISLQIPLS